MPYLIGEEYMRQAAQHEKSLQLLMAQENRDNAMCMTLIQHIAEAYVINIIEKGRNQSFNTLLESKSLLKFKKESNKITYTPIKYGGDLHKTFMLWEDIINPSKFNNPQKRLFHPRQAKELEANKMSEKLWEIHSYYKAFRYPRENVRPDEPIEITTEKYIEFVQTLQRLELFNSQICNKHQPETLKSIYKMLSSPEKQME